MSKRLDHVALLVPDHDDAMAFFLRIGFECRKHTDLGHGKPWIRVAPRHGETEILLARATDARQASVIGNQWGGRVGFFLQTEDFDADQARLRAAYARSEGSTRRELQGASPPGRPPRAIGGI